MSIIFKSFQDTGDLINNCLLDCFLGCGLRLGAVSLGVGGGTLVCAGDITMNGQCACHIVCCVNYFLSSKKYDFSFCFLLLGFCLFARLLLFYLFSNYKVQPQKRNRIKIREAFVYEIFL